MDCESCVTEKIDEKGNRWFKAYCGGGAHFRNWLAQCREIGEVMVEEIDATGYTCFEESGEKLYCIWVKTAHPEAEAHKPFDGPPENGTPP